MVKLIETPTRWAIEINPDLQFAKEQLKEKGIIWQWGRDKKGMYKIMYAYYPKTFSKSDMKRITLKYIPCPNCLIGKKNLNFINPKNNNKSMALREFSFVGSLERIPRLGAVIARSETSRTIVEQWLMQALGKLAQMPIDAGMKKLGAKILKAIIGLGGTAALARLRINQRLKNEFITFLANIGTDGFDPTLEESAELIEEAKGLVRDIRAGSFYGAADRLIKSPEELRVGVARVRDALMMAFGKIGKKGRFWRQPLTHKGRPFKTLQAEDYVYQDSLKRFQDVSKFSPSFINRTRFRIAGEEHYGY